MTKVLSLLALCCFFMILSGGCTVDKIGGYIVQINFDGSDADFERYLLEVNGYILDNQKYIRFCTDNDTDFIKKDLTIRVFDKSSATLVSERILVRTTCRYLIEYPEPDTVRERPLMTEDSYLVLTPEGLIIDSSELLPFCSDIPTPECSEEHYPL